MITIAIVAGITIVLILAVVAIATSTNAELPGIPDWPCDDASPHLSHFWSDGVMGFECPGVRR